MDDLRCESLTPDEMRTAVTTAAAAAASRRITSRSPLSLHVLYRLTVIELVTTSRNTTARNFSPLLVYT